MVSFDKLIIIAKSKFSDKSKLGDWYTSRIDICKLCPLNTKNIEHLSLKEAAILSVNLGQDSCVGCGCEITAKASVRSEQCGAVKRGLPALWPALPDIKQYDFKNISIENLSADKVALDTMAILVIDYGNIARGADTNIELLIKGINSPITNVSVTAGCGCTTTAVRQGAKGYTLKISYDSTRVGQFNKTVVLRFTQNGERQMINAKLKGNI